MTNQDFDFVLPPETESGVLYGTAPWLTVDKVSAEGKYDDWLRVLVHETELRRGSNGSYLNVLYQSMLDAHPWQLSQNYFGGGGSVPSELLAGFMRAIELDRLSKDTLSKLTGKRLEVKVTVATKRGRSFVNVIEHKKITQLKEVVSG